MVVIAPEPPFLFVTWSTSSNGDDFDLSRDNFFSGFCQINVSRMI